MALVTDLTARRLELVLATAQAEGRVPSVAAALTRDGSLVWRGSRGDETGVPGDASGRPAVPDRVDHQDHDRRPRHAAARRGAAPPARPALGVPAGARRQRRDRARVAVARGGPGRGAARAVVGAGRGRHVRRPGRGLQRVGGAVRAGVHPPLQQPRLRPARGAGRPGERCGLVGLRHRAHPRAARHAAHLLRRLRPARAGLLGGPVRAGARPRSRPPTPGRWPRPARCGAPCWTWPPTPTS